MNNPTPRRFFFSGFSLGVCLGAPLSGFFPSYARAQGLPLPKVMETVPSSSLPSSPQDISGGVVAGAMQQALEGWDAFLVFILKGIGVDLVEPGIRDGLFDTLLISRYGHASLLSGETTAPGPEGLRSSFFDTWSMLYGIVDDARQRGLLGEKANRYAEFFQAGKVLFSGDTGTPGSLMPVSPDELRRIARLLRPEATEDPLAYTVAVDASSRALFGFPAELSRVETRTDRVASRGWGMALAFAEESAPGEIATLSQRLDRWVPDTAEFPEYKPVVLALVQRTTDQILQPASLDLQYFAIFRTMMPAVALQESCWRHFKRSQNQIITHASSSSVGLMQINQYVWRGFYDIEQLKRNVGYNARAGAEILLRYFQRYGVKESEETGTLENSARGLRGVQFRAPCPQTVSRGKK